MSAPTPVFVGLVQDGRLHLDYRKQFDAYLKRFDGHEVEVEVRKRRSKRSDKQNRYWWGVLVATLAQHTGYTADEMHEALKAKFIAREDVTLGLMRIGSTAKLNTVDFAELVDKVVLWAAEDLGVVIPLPEQDTAARKARAA